METFHESQVNNCITAGVAS